MSAITVKVDIPPHETHYPIRIEPGCLLRLGQLLAENFSLSIRFLVITDETVDGLYGQTVMTQLHDSGFTAHKVVIPDGEPSKSLESACRIYDEALKLGVSRKDVILALGGGVVGDLAGYCAATYYRGTHFVQVPTTLLAQVDSSVGGKVAVNYSSVKNGIGAFYQPQLVLIDPDVLSTLDSRQIRAGMAEVVKYGLIENTCCSTDGFFTQLCTMAEASNGDVSGHYGGIIRRCCEIKAQVVALDETELTGVRFYLNLGHTFAHAYEAASGYGKILHGEAVSMGMLKACQLSNALDLFPESETERYKMLATQLKLALDAPQGLDKDQLLSLMRQDKKALSGLTRFVLPAERIGQCVVRDDIHDRDVLAIL